MTFVNVTAPEPALTAMLGSWTEFAEMVRVLAVTPESTMVAVLALRVNPVVVAMFQTVTVPVEVAVSVDAPRVTVRVAVDEESYCRAVMLNPAVLNMPPVPLSYKPKYTLPTQ